MATYGNYIFGLNEIVLVNAAAAHVHLNAAQSLKFTERLVSGELKGNDQLLAVVAFSEAVEWELENGGIPLDAYAMMTGRTVVTSGTTPTETTHLIGRGAAVMPYFKIYGKAMGAGIDDVHCKLFKCKLTDTIEGTFQNGEFFVTSCKGLAVDDGTTGIYEFIQHETAAALPSA